MSTQAHGLRRRLAAAPAAMPSAPMLGARSMAIASGKGGVGKTALATSLALSASARGARVLLVDLDLGLANAHLLFGCPTGAGLLETLEQGEPPARALVEARPRVRLVAGARRPETTARLSGAERTRLLAAIAALGRESDLLIVDLPAGIGALVIETLRACASPMLVTTPEPAAFADAYALLKRFQLAGAARPIDIVVNAVRRPQELRRVERRLLGAARRFLRRDVAILDAIPEDPAVREATRKPACFLETAPCAPAARAVHRIERRVARGLARRDSTTRGPQEVNT